MSRVAIRAVAPLIALGCAAPPQPTAQTKPLPSPGMVRIPAGTYAVGSDSAYPEEAPARRVTVAAFWIDRTEVTKARFAAFARATGYRTLAERSPDPARHPGADPKLLKPGSAVFIPGRTDDPLTRWRYQPGANWRRGRDQDPVTHVAYEDAIAYARWAGKDLPTEEEWEAASGANGHRYPWGDTERSQGRWMANVWQGPFPIKDSGDDGYRGVAPVGSFPANRYGLFDMAGNVWEWTRTDGDGVGAKITKGGSYLCAREYCHRYRPSARQSVTVDTSTSHIGFRCVIRDPSPPRP